jgi:hypothetical protein
MLNAGFLSHRFFTMIHVFHSQGYLCRSHTLVGQSEPNDKRMISTKIAK